MKKAKPQPIRAARLETLDGRRVFQGIDTLADASKLTDDHLPQIGECDLPPGRYFWDEANSTFAPIPKKTQRGSTDLPAQSLNVLALTIHTLKQAGMPQPQESLDWLDWYVTTNDFKALAAKYAIKGAAK